MKNKSEFDMTHFKTVAEQGTYGPALAQLGEENKNIVLLVADCLNSTRGNVFAAKFPERTFNFGIAEANMVGAAAGMALAGKLPIVAGYGFLVSMRVAEQIRTDICYPNLNVKIVATASGLTMGTGGTTHHCTEDIGIMRTFANMAVICPASPIETAKALRASVEYKGPVYLRLERDINFGGTEEVYEGEGVPFEIGKAVTLKQGKDVTIIATGQPVGLALKSANALESEGISARVLNMHTVKPIDAEAIRKAAGETKGIVVVEEHNIHGGLGDAVASFICMECPPTRVRRIGISDEFCCIGSMDSIWDIHGLTQENIIKAVKSITT